VSSPVNPVRIESIQAANKRIAVRTGEGVERDAQKKNLDIAPFKLDGNNDQMFLVGPGLKMDGLRQTNATVSYQGKNGQVNGQVMNRTNTFTEWMRHPISLASIAGLTVSLGLFGAVAGQLTGSVLRGALQGGLLGLTVTSGIMAGIGLLVEARHSKTLT